jgi:predicted metal-dependent enzyme (double-stranded beta helix superfamily)
MNWIVTSTGSCENLDEIQFERPELSQSHGESPVSSPESYRLFRFLTDLEDILLKFPSDRDRIAAISPLMRLLLTDSYWLQVPEEAADPDLGWAVQTLYDEPFFDLTVQLVTWLPGTKSEIHNHATWGVIAMISGSEKNTLWQRSPTLKHPDRIIQVGEKVISYGEIIGFLPDAIHQIEALGDQPTISLNLYGKTDYDARFEFDPLAHTALIY